MARLVWAEPALSDLDASAEYIALDNPRAARDLVQRVFARVERVRSFPKMGSIPPQIPDLPYRQLQIPLCRVFYRIETSVVYILHVMRAEQLLRWSLLNERFAKI